MLANRHGRGDAPLLAYVSVTNLTSALVTLPPVVTLQVRGELVRLLFIAGKAARVDWNHYKHGRLADARHVGWGWL